MFSYSDRLGIDDLDRVLKSVWNASDQWYNIGLVLRISPLTLDAIEHENDNHPTRCSLKMLEAWLKRSEPPPTWQELAECLRSPIVGYGALAEQLTRH